MTNRKIQSTMKKVLLPVVRPIFRAFRALVAIIFRRVYHSSKAPDLKGQHLSNTKLLATRSEMIGLFPKNAIVAEIGVDSGDFSQLILNVCSPQKLHLIDIWGTNRYGERKKKYVHERFEKEIGGKSIEIDVGLSTDVVENFPDGYFDWIYIDTDHSYSTTKQELQLYSKKVKSGGIIAGHDFVSGNWDSLLKYGVIEAVSEFCVENNWELAYLTFENSINPSFAIRALVSE